MTLELQTPVRLYYKEYINHSSASSSSSSNYLLQGIDIVFAYLCLLN